MTQKHSPDLYGNVIDHRNNNVFVVALNTGGHCDASIPKPVARDMFRVVPGDPVAIRRSNPPRLNRIVGFSPCLYYKRYWDDDSGGLCAGWGGSHFLFEVHPDGWVSRQIQYFDNGELLLYDETLDEDDFGGRSTVALDAGEYAPFTIDKSEFVRKWKLDLAANRVGNGGEHIQD
jgi:hypothetical protein